jgi:serine/threonine-protein kinase
MGANRWNQVALLFETATSLPPDQRAAYLDEASSGDPELRREVEALLAADGVTSSFLVGAVGGAAREAARDLAPAPALLGSRIGPYEVTRELGHGGMGTVYLAVRADDAYAKSVAIKVIRRGADNPEIRRRFLAERQILATLDHPYIGRLLDGGATAEGLPYVVMEFIEGQPLDVFCDQHSLSLPARLRLFLKASEAVQYAHGSLVVHRDLKPSNILVTADGTPKLLDFGIAKLLDAPAGEPATRTAVRLMTPEYASPEQVRGEPVTTRTDVYSLGVVLYELLTGRRPFRGTQGLEQAICEQEPERPSAAVARDEEAARARGVRPDRLRKALAGDLDTIVLAALRKEPDRRYASVEQLAEDIRRHLDGRPVRARRDTFGYRAGKYVRRHRAGVAAALAVVGLTGFYTVQLTRERDRARLEAAKAAQVATFLQDLFSASDPTETRGRDVTARELVDRGAERLERELAGQPAVRAAMLGVLGRVYSSLGAYDTAVTILRKAATLHRSGDPNDPARASVLASLGAALQNTGDIQSPDSLYHEALRIRRAAFGADHPQVAESLADLANYFEAKGDLDTADSLFHAALEMERRVGTEDRVASHLDGLAGVLRLKGDYAGAERYFREAVELVERSLSPDTLVLATARHNLAGALSDLGRLGEAEPLFRGAMDVYVRYLGDSHPFVGATQSELGRLLRDAGRLEEAEALFTLALESERRRSGNTHPEVAVRLGFLAGIQLQRGDFAGAELRYREALAIRRAAYGDEHAYVAISVNELAGALHARGDLPAAEALFRQALALRRRVHEAGHPYIAYSLVGLGRVLGDRGKSAEAEPLLREALGIRQRVLPPAHWAVGQAQAALGESLMRLGRFAEAESLLVSGSGIIRAARGDADSDLARAMERLEELYRATGRPAPASR